MTRVVGRDGTPLGTRPHGPGMDELVEKRVFDDRVGDETLFVAADAGVVSVAVSGDRVGGFSLLEPCAPADLAAGGGRVAVATDSDVLVGDADGVAAASFGRAVAVGFDGGRPVAADPDGRLGRLTGEEWTDLGRTASAVRAIDAPLIAAADGVYRLPGLDFAGLDDVRDVAAAGPLAATGGGLYALGNGWMAAIDGAFEVAAADGTRAHAASASALFERADDGWRAADLPVDEPVADVAYGRAAYAVTAEGTVLADDGEGWRATTLGVDGVVGCAVV